MSTNADEFARRLGASVPGAALSPESPESLMRRCNSMMEDAMKAMVDSLRREATCQELHYLHEKYPEPWGST